MLSSMILGIWSLLGTSGRRRTALPAIRTRMPARTKRTPPKRICPAVSEDERPSIFMPVLTKGKALPQRAQLNMAPRKTTQPLLINEALSLLFKSIHLL